MYTWYWDGCTPGTRGRLRYKSVYLVLRWMYNGTPGTPGKSRYKYVYLVFRWVYKGTPGTPGTPGRSRY